MFVTMKRMGIKRASLLLGLRWFAVATAREGTSFLSGHSEWFTLSSPPPAPLVSSETCSAPLTRLDDYGMRGGLGGEEAIRREGVPPPERGYGRLSAVLTCGDWASAVTPLWGN